MPNLRNFSEAEEYRRYSFKKGHEKRYWVKTIDIRLGMVMNQSLAIDSVELSLAHPQLDVNIRLLW